MREAGVRYLVRSLDEVDESLLRTPVDHFEHARPSPVRSHTGSGRSMSASLAGLTTAVISVMWPSATVKARRESGVPSSLQEMTPGRPLTLAAASRGP